MPRPLSRRKAQPLARVRANPFAGRKERTLPLTLCPVAPEDRPVWEALFDGYAAFCQTFSPCPIGAATGWGGR